MPISLTRCPTGLLYMVNNFFASNLVSKILFSNAKNGANGNAATKIVTNPYCSTTKKKIITLFEKIEYTLNYISMCISSIYITLINYLLFFDRINDISLYLPISKYSGKRLLGPHWTNL